MQGTSASGSTTMRDGSVQSSHSWSATPAGRLTPGQKLQFTVSVSVRGPQNQTPWNLGAGTHINVYFEPGGGPRGMGGIDVGFVTNTPNRPSASKVLDWTVPSGSRDQKMIVFYTARTPTGSGETRYIYEWVE